MGLTHIDAQGRARMVDVGDKADTVRMAKAVGVLRCESDTLDAVAEGRVPKGAVVSTAEIAGIMAAKRTADLVPMCHPLALTSVAVAIAPDPAMPGFRIEASVKTKGPTGVEMEALTAVSVAALTLFDMLKAIDRTMTIDAIGVVEKSGGKSDDWKRP
ncbi:Cyclic pyranopterin monophosphate synthase accessory protein [Tsuneonella dongtanensis]|uniref:Cyclic pyranopterin monophosphate synthase n=1 Tax=Tsuneonella dongtanensis TaxID=692370 RepID=A0A1B2A914_9SPHN|nr:cyclic pyranopterin monophosphate synthase MoaC [Tsuneonella dongtanensis]ANY18622.1 Cyclic pyranopterin monophosphate synthase accessory protein [Tsuneonella dongtanensis]